MTRQNIAEVAHGVPSAASRGITLAPLDASRIKRTYIETPKTIPSPNDPAVLEKRASTDHSTSNWFALIKCTVLHYVDSTHHKPMVLVKMRWNMQLLYVPSHLTRNPSLSSEIAYLR